MFQNHVLTQIITWFFIKMAEISISVHLNVDLCKTSGHRRLWLSYGSQKMNPVRSQFKVSSLPKTGALGRNCHMERGRSGIALLCSALHCFALFCVGLLCFAMRCFAMSCIDLHCFALHCLALLCIALLCNALHCRDLHRVAFHCCDLYWFALRGIAVIYIG